MAAAGLPSYIARVRRCGFIYRGAFPEQSIRSPTKTAPSLQTRTLRFCLYGILKSNTLDGTNLQSYLVVFSIKGG